MSRHNLALVIAIPVLVLIGLTVGLTAPAPDKDYLLLKQIAEVLARLDRDYVRALGDEERVELIENMIDGGLRRLDDHSEYMNMDRARQFTNDTDGQFEGIGVSISPDPVSKFLRIEGLIPNTPAYESGLAAGDLITRVNGTSTHGITIDGARKLIMGQAGTPVELATQREARNPAEQTLQVTRGNILVNPVSGVRRIPDNPKSWDFMLDPEAKIGYVRIATFSAKATDELVAALKQLHEQGAKGVFLDLRDDPGGLLPQAISVADLFLPQGRIVSTRNRTATEQEFDAHPAKEDLAFIEQIPMAVLVNRQSASASEIVAAALQDYKRAVIVGERTFGKGSVQKLFTIPGPPRASLKITTETYWRPSGKNIHRDPRKSKETDEWGVKPDFEVPLTDEERLRWLTHLRGRDYVPGKPGLAPKPPEPKKDDKPFEDKVLQKAIEELKKVMGGTGFVPREAPAALPEAVRA